ncbi:MAG TPA: hypothetical protein VIL66_08010 [Bacillota bacterium]
MMEKDLDRPVSQPMLADNAEETVKCPVCGRLIEMGMIREDADESGETIDCPVCHSQVNLDEARHLVSSNEGY